MKTKNISKLVAIITAFAAANPEGFTFNLNTMKAQKTGYAVAVKETQNSFGSDGLKKAVMFAIKNNIPCVGGWYDSESTKFYFDATKIFSEREKAIKEAIKNEQLALFHLDTLEEIRTK